VTAATAVIVTSMRLIVGSNSTVIYKPTLFDDWLIAATTDNLTNSISIHMYQESEQGRDPLCEIRNTLAQTTCWSRLGRPA
jgi:hypothetical protein